MTCILPSLLELHTRNMQLGLPISQLPLNTSEEFLQNLEQQFTNEAGLEAQEYLAHCVELAQQQICEQVSLRNLQEYILVRL